MEEENDILLPGLEGFVYRGPTFLELEDKLKSNPIVYNLILQNVARTNNPTREIVTYKDANGNTRTTTNVSAGVLSPVDPIGEFYVSGKMADPVIKGVGILGKNTYHFLLKPGENFFKILPYNFLNSLEGGFKKLGNFFKTPITENPFKHLVSYQDKRMLASSRPLKNVLSQQNYKITLEDPIKLLKERTKHVPISKYDIIGVLGELENTIINTPIRTHTGIVLAFKDLKGSGESTFNSLILLPNYYLHANTNPAYFNYVSKPFIQINPSAKIYGLNNKEHILAHELAHSLWRVRPKNSNYFYYDELVAPGFNFKFLPERVKTYFMSDGGNELAARGTQLKNYFGITDNSPLTGDMLKYAAKNYTKDTGLDNNMNLLFRSITDWDKAAAWLSKYSYKLGGILRFLM